ncbi:MAG: histidine kinase [Bacteroidia bacterium]|nr:histidine kinase [Bacteroidia bacterium]
MFNVLNSLASLARKKSDELEPMIIQLSQLMRYSLYQNGDRRVNLADEVHYLENYINLQKLRYGKVAEIEFSAEIQNAELNIEPMLLIPFVENAFKHGIGVEGRPIILVILRMTDFTLHFMVKNKFNPVNIETKDSSSGIGLQNVRRRLNLLYKDMHELHTYTTGDGWYVAELKLILR